MHFVIAGNTLLLTVTGGAAPGGVPAQLPLQELDKQCLFESFSFLETGLPSSGYGVGGGWGASGVGLQQRSGESSDDCNSRNGLNWP